MVQAEANERCGCVVANSGVEGQLRSPGRAIVVRVRNPHRVECLHHADIATGGVLCQVSRNPSNEYAPRVRTARWSDADSSWNRVAERIALRYERASDCAGCHGG